MSLSIFGFRALWSPYFFVSLLIVLGLFFLLTVKFRHRFANSEALTVREGVFFTSAIVILYIIKGSPIDLMGHLMFYAHMIQMGILYLVIPILFIHGIPTWVWRAVINHPKVKPLFNFFTKPLIALIFFNGLFSFYHIPLIFDFIKTDMTLHSIYTVMLFIFAVFMWWPLTNKLPEHQTLSGLKKVGYIFADGILLTPACALIIFADTPMYATFSDPQAWGQALALCVPASTLASLDLSGPEMFNSMSLLHDQQLGGVIMKVIQEIVYGYVLALVFFSWFRKEEADAKALENNLMNPRPAE
ncbi:cytochrome c oxidase assembly factor CtaG [Cytobacillus purgationiresistens]|uniref:Membrane protein n=1 Tax=Cytobacillus purgationiresistens TaxID=863449 RepID=A0ABU0ANV0_9BACI|nr:cytochrome c oxidase assembly factor CtaG [Cytobacillus purgationiresistens]MDQ0272406.1 putative membrane protein [Cytobacillus purgationiresistens]